MVDPPDREVLRPARGDRPPRPGTGGLGVVFPFAGSEEEKKRQATIREAHLAPAGSAAAQAGRVKERYYREFVGPEAFRPNDTKPLFLGRSKATPGSPADPEKVPYYLMIVGDPETIPYRFQYQLDVEYAVGASTSTARRSTARYAQSVVEAESGGRPRPRRAVFFGVRNDNDLATSLSTEHLVQPLVRLLESKPELAQDWQFSTVLAEDATKARLGRLLGGDETPALLFTASHGMEFLPEDRRQPGHQGALLCRDWPGPLRWPAGQPIPPEHYFSADDVPEAADLRGLIAFHFACYGGGHPPAR